MRFRDRHFKRLNGGEPGWVLLMALMSIVSIILTADRFGEISPILWDLRVYQRAVAEFISGYNPWSSDHGFLFVYHPYVLRLLVFFDSLFPLQYWLLGFYGIASLLFLHFGFRLCVAPAISPSCRPSGPVLMILLLAAIAYGGAGTLAFMTGNMTPYLHFFLMAIFAAWGTTGRRSWTWCYLAAVTFFGIIKPYFLAYLLLLFAVVPARQGLIIGIASVLAAALIFFSAALSVPSDFDSYLAALEQQILTKADLGYSVYGLIHRFGTATGAFLVHFGASMVLIALSIYWAGKVREPLRRNMLPLIIVAVIINPRMKEYDFLLAVIVLFTWLYLTFGRDVLKYILAAMIFAGSPQLVRVARETNLMILPGIIHLDHLFQMLGVAGLCLFGLFRLCLPGWHERFR